MYIYIYIYRERERERKRERERERYITSIGLFLNPLCPLKPSKTHAEETSETHVLEHFTKHFAAKHSRGAQGRRTCARAGRMAGA